MNQQSLVPLKAPTNPEIGSVRLHRKCACEETGATCARCTNKKSGLQRKLAIGASNDPLEQEADRVADQVMAAPGHSAVSAIPPRIQRYVGQTTEGTDSAPASVDHVIARSGRPLDPTLKRDMEQRFGHNFSQVRVHSGADAEQSVRDVNANAYTVGNNIVFGTGRFAPSSPEGRRLIAHELTHVVQQSGGDGTRTGRNNEKRAVSSIPAVNITGVSGLRLARSESDEEDGPRIARFGKEEVNELIDMWKEKIKNESDPKIKKQYKKYITNLRERRVVLGSNREKNLGKQSETEITHIHSLIGGTGPKAYMGGRNIKMKGAAGPKGSTVPDFTTSNVLGEIKNFNVFLPNLDEDTAEKNLKKLEKQIADRKEKGPFDIKQQTIVMDIRGQKATPQQLQKLGKTVAQRVGVPTKNIQIVIWDTPESSKPGSAKPAITSQTGVSSVKPPSQTTASKSPSTPKKSSIVKKVVTGAAIAAAVLSTESKATAAEKTETTSVAPKQPSPGASVAGSEKITPTTSAKPSIKPTVPVTTPATPTGKPPVTSEVKGVTPSQSTASNPTIPSGAVKPAAPTKAGSPTGSTSATSSSPGSAAALGGLAQIAEQYAKSSLADISVADARFKALADLEKKRDKIFEEMWSNPGQGMSVTFLFMSVIPKNGQPPRLEYLNLGTLPSTRQKTAFVGLSREQAVEIQELKKSDGLTVDDNITRNIWLKPLPSRDDGKTVEKPKETETTPTFIATTEAFIQNTLSLNKGNMLRYELSAFELLKQSSSTSSGYLANYEGLKLQIPHPLFNQLLTYFESRVRDKLTKTLDELNRKMEFYKKQLKDRREESWLSKIINSRGDIPLDPDMFNAPEAHLVSAAGNIKNGAYRHAEESLEKAEVMLNEKEAWLFRYDKGYFPAWHDSIQ